MFTHRSIDFPYLLVINHQSGFPFQYTIFYFFFHFQFLLFIILKTLDPLIDLLFHLTKKHKTLLMFFWLTGPHRCWVMLKRSDQNFVATIYSWKLSSLLNSSKTWSIGTSNSTCLRECIVQSCIHIATKSEPSKIQFTSQ